MSEWRAARSIDVLRRQVNAEYPDRPTEADGVIGDLAHSQRKSSHNPDARGVVRAWDITTAPFCDQLAQELAELGKTDERVWYVIWDRRIASREHGFAWYPYTGKDPHTGHIHLSVSDDPAVYDRIDPWPVLGQKPTPPAAPSEGDDMTDAQAKQLREVRKIAAVTDDRVNKLTAKVDEILALLKDK